MHNFRARVLATTLAALVASGSVGAPDARADALPPLDHTGALATVPQVVAAGSPAYLLGGIDEAGTWTAAAGVADRSTHAAASPDAAFRIGSISKMFLSVAVLQLAAAGRIGLDDAVDTYLPGLLKLGDVITVRELLQHRSGLGFTKETGLSSRCNATYDPTKVIKSADVQLFAPGTNVSYSNAGYVVLELILEKVTDESYQEVLAHQIIDPLHLSHTRFQEGRPVWPGPYLHGYDRLPGTGNYAQDHLFDQTDCSMSIYGAAGSGISTLEDLLTFMYALMHGRLLPASMFAQMTDLQPTDGALRYSQYGLGIGRYDVASCGVELIGHSGLVDGYAMDLYSTVDGSRMFADVVTVVPAGSAVYVPWYRAVDAEVCGA